MEHLQLEKREGGLFFIRFENGQASMNTISEAMLNELDEALGEIETEKSAGRALVFISGKPDNFIAGADIREFDQKMTGPGIARQAIERVHSIFDRIEGLPFPVIAAINGACLGGGLELALACHFRIVTDSPKTRLGLPEVTLGVLPAGGGTVRLTRLIGIRRALALMLKGRVLNHARARAAGIADIAAYPYDLENTAVRCIPLFEKRFAKRRRKIAA